LKKKIVILGTAHPFRGGLATYNERLAREYMHQGHEVIIYTFSLQYPGFLFPGKTQFSDTPAPKDLDIRVKVNSINPFNWCRVGREIRKLNPDLLIIKYWLPFMSPCFGTIARKVKKNKHTKVVSILDNIIPHEKRFFDKQFSNYFVKPVDGFVAMSRSVLNDLDVFDKDKPRIFCEHPLYDNFGESLPKEQAQHNLGLDPQFRYMLFFGFIRDYKGLDILLNAFADKRFENKMIRLIVAGEFYSDSKPFYEMITRLKLRDSVIMSTDFIPDDEVVSYFCASDIIVQPYKSATQSGVTQIAYHFNKPMIVTDVGGLAEIIPNNKVGYVVKPDPAELADAILKFFNEKKEEEFSKNAAIEKLKYGWDRMTAAIESIIK
jgi:D-inositol-3-phosphate glycosyltransferase